MSCWFRVLRRRVIGEPCLMATRLAAGRVGEVAGGGATFVGVATGASDGFAGVFAMECLLGDWPIGAVLGDGSVAENDVMCGTTFFFPATAGDATFAGGIGDRGVCAFTAGRGDGCFLLSRDFVSCLAEAEPAAEPAAGPAAELGFGAATEEADFGDAVVNTRAVFLPAKAALMGESLVGVLKAAALLTSAFPGVVGFGVLLSSAFNENLERNTGRGTRLRRGLLSVSVRLVGVFSSSVEEFHSGRCASGTGGIF